MKYKIDKRLYLMIAIIAVAIIGVFVAATCCIINMRYAINKQIYSNLRDVAEQTESAIEKRVDLYVDLMINLRTELEEMEDEGGDPHTDIIKLQEAADLNGLLRVAFCDADGKAYGSDNVINGTDLSGREFYKRGMEGKSTITEELTDLMGTHEKINIITSPWYADDGSIRGVFGITFYASKMSELLHVDAFDGEGGSFAINESGTVVIDSRGSSSETSHISEQLIDVLNSDERNSEYITEIEEALRSNSTDDDIIDTLDDNRYVYIDGTRNLYYQTILKFDSLGDDVQWRIFTIVSQDYVDSRFFVINLDFYILVGIFIIIMLISIIALMIIARRHRTTIEQVAYIDPITGGANFPMFIKQMRSAKVKYGAFVSVDMIEFNSVRVAVGAEEGDNILREVYRDIEKHLKENELIAHVGRDNFAIFMCVTDESVLRARLKEISDSLLTLSHNLKIPHIRCRCGAYISRYFTEDRINECCNCAGQAREMARRNNKSYWLYDETDNEKAIFERKLAGFFPEALDNREFEVWYQPKYSVKTGKIVGAEALVRWRREGQLIPPGKFIPLFERNGLISQLDLYMFKEVCIRQQHRRLSGKRVEPVSVNLSRATMYNDHIIDEYMKILNSYHVDIKSVQIEVTESAVIGKDDLASLLREFRGMGEHILLDDFGTGYSSLSMLSLKCFDTLKIDKSLVDNIESENGETLISNIVHMAHQLDMSVTAEGVEEKNQYELLRVLECDDIQGFYFSKPLPRDEYEALLDSGA